MMGKDRPVFAAKVILQHLVPDGPIDLVGDDTVDGHPGPKVYGKARHRDAVRSSHSYRTPEVSKAERRPS